MQVVPCVLLTVLSALLIVAMRRADRRRRLLKMKGRRMESELIVYRVVRRPIEPEEVGQSRS